MKILGIETSCDETAVCIIEAAGDLTDFSYTVLGNSLISQTEIHKPYGGVFPNLAKREHGRNLVPLLGDVLRQADLLNEERAVEEKVVQGVERILDREHELGEFLATFLRTYGIPKIDAIAVTSGPGLEPALWVGINFAKALAFAWNLPIVPVNHMEGHVVISALSGKNNHLKFPLLSLLISGGHTELVLSNDWMHYKLLGQTRDDAVGEAFDKVARLMELPYPGGPEIERLAREAREKNIERAIRLPRPMIDSDDYDFSFAGLKTAVRKVVESSEVKVEKFTMMLAREFEDAATEVLVAKTMRALDDHGVKTLVVGGGVSANTHIKEALAQAVRDYGLDIDVRIPSRDLATDNALMIALAGYFHAQKKEFAVPDSIRAEGNLKLAY